MGAIWDYTISQGKNAKEAYAKATSEAYTEFGHNAYNGTLTTSSGFQEVMPPHGKSYKELIALIQNENKLTSTYPSVGKKWESCGAMKLKANTYAFWGIFAT